MRRIWDRRVPWLALLVALVAALALVAGGGDVARADPGPVNAGYDLLETDSNETYQDLTLPADFFGPGSDPFIGRVYLEGVPFDVFGGFNGLTPTDTIVERLQDAGPAFPDTIDIEIVRLELKSVQPITVTYNGGQNPEDWDMTAQVPEGDLNQTTGSMTIRHETAEGGTFDSTLPVDPLLTFTKVGGGGVVGPLYLSGLVGGPLVFQVDAADNAPWCHTANPLHSPPHTVIEKAGLTTNFFPGILCEADGPEVTRTKLWTPESALEAKHTVRPAEVAIHYRCYDISGAVHDPGVLVTVVDQFGETDVVVGLAHWLCAPALKNGEPGDLTATHLKCYDILGDSSPDIVNLETQFGLEEDVELGVPKQLCIPVNKQVLPGAPPPPPEPGLPHYQCYDISGNDHYANEQVEIEDQFGVTPGVPVTKAMEMCAPALKEGDGDPYAAHLKCYDISDLPFNPIEEVALTTQFGIEDPVNVELAQRLCIPAVKELVIPPVGGTAQYPDVDASPATTADSSGDSSSPPYAAIAGAAAAAAVVALAVSGGWYVRRRRPS